MIPTTTWEQEVQRWRDQQKLPRVYRPRVEGAVIREALPEPVPAPRVRDWRETFPTVPARLMAGPLTAPPDPTPTKPRRRRKEPKTRIVQGPPWPAYPRGWCGRPAWHSRAYCAGCGGARPMLTLSDRLDDEEDRTHVCSVQCAMLALPSPVRALWADWDDLWEWEAWAP